MRRLLLLLLLAVPLQAAEIEAGGQHVLSRYGDNGELEIETSRGFSAHAEIFWRDALSARVSATFLNPATIFYPDDPPPADVDLGTLGLDLYAVTARWHLAPQARLSAFAGAGGALVVIGNLDDRFGEDVEIEFDPEMAPVVEAGVRYRFRPRIFLEAGVTYVPVEAEGNVIRSSDPRVQVPETIAVDPMMVSVGAAWRF
jgi:hypothetical protein